MTSSKHENVWDLLNKYNFEIDSYLFNDLMCVICKKLLRNARQSFCGCRYCNDCIEHYLDNQEKLCPGALDYCKEQLINIAKDIHVDHVANMKVSRLSVKCPELDCQFNNELRYLDAHIDSHHSKCPYFDIGCDKTNINNGNLSNHLHDNNLSHTNLLMDSIQNMKNEMAFLKEDSKKKETIILACQSELTSMKMTNNFQQTIIDQLSNSIRESESTNQTLTNEMSVLKNELKNIRTNQVKVETVNKLSNKLDSVTKENKNSIQKLEQKILSMKDSSNNKNSNCSNNNNKDKDKDNKDKTPLPSMLKKVPAQLNIENPFIPLYNIPKINLAPFEWKIENFTRQRMATKDVVNSFIFSQPFYSKIGGYKLRLIVYLNGYSNGSKKSEFSIGLNIMPGEFDDQLSWPMTHKITIALMDQKTGEIHSSELYHYSLESMDNKNKFYRPIIDMNIVQGSNKFININGLINNGKLCKNDSIVIKGLVE